MNNQNYIYRQLSAEHKAMLSKGLMGMDEEADIVKSATELCPMPSVVESVECLIEQVDRISCPQGKRLEALEHFCKNNLDVQRGLLGRSLRFTDAYIEYVLALGTTAKTEYKFWENTLTKDVEIGITNLGKGQFNKDRPFVLSAFQLQYGQGASEQEARFGRVYEETTSGVTYKYIDFPTRIASGLFHFSVGSNNGDVIEPIPVSRFVDYTFDLNAVGFLKLDTTLHIPDEQRILGTIRLNQAFGFTPPAVGGASFLKLIMHGTGIIKA